MNNYSEFQVNIFSNNRDIRLHLENSKLKKGHGFVKKNWRITSPNGIGSPFIRLHLENSKSKKGHNFVKKNGGLPPLLVLFSLLIVNNYSEFQVNIFSYNRDIKKFQSFRTTTTPRL